MAISADVATGQQATAAQYNALRDDIWQYVEMTTVNNQVGGTAWADYDLSALIPAGAKAVVIEAVGYGNNGYITVGVRKNGSATAWNVFSVESITTNSAFTSYTTIVECDANRIIEIIASVATNVKFYLKGYFISIGA